MSTPRSTARRRAAPLSRHRVSAVTAVVLVALAASAVLLSGSVPSPTDRAGTARGELVTDTLAACPDLNQPAGTSTRFEAGSLASPDLPANGTFGEGPIGAKASPVPLNRGDLLRLPSAAGRAPVLRAEGGLAAGLFGYRTDTDTKNRTLAVARCTAPRATWWFTGAGATLDHTSELVMANVDPGPAVVDVRVLGPDGEVQTIGTKGITIGPGARKVIKLTDVAPQGKELAVNVHASRGRVVAAISDNFAEQAGADPGSEWLPDQASASRVLRLAGLPAKGGSRTLLVANPSELEARVDVRVSGKSASFAPTGLNQLRVPPASVRSVEVAKAIGSGPAALRLRSSVPVVATVRSMSGADSSYAGGVGPLVEPAAAPVLARGTTTVLLTAGALEGRATITAYDAAGHQVDTADLSIRPTATTSWKPKKGAAYLVVTPRRGAVFGAVTLTGTGTSQVPLVGLPIRLQRPSVRPAIG